MVIWWLVREKGRSVGAALPHASVSEGLACTTYHLSFQNLKVPSQWTFSETKAMCRVDLLARQL